MSGSILANAFADANKPTVAPADYMEQMRQAGQVVQGLNQNKLFQAQQARGQIMAQATDESGVYHPEIANRLAAQRPDAGLAMPQIVSQGSELTTQGLDQSGARNKYLSGQLGALQDLPDDKLKQGLADTATRIRQSRMFPDGEIDTVLSHLSNDPATLRQQLRQAQLSVQSPGEQEGQIFGTRPQVNTGGNVQFPIVPSAASGKPAPTVTNTPAPQFVNQGDQATPTSGGQPIGPSLSINPGPEYGNLSLAQRLAVSDVFDIRPTLPDGSPNPDFKRKVPITFEEQLRRNGINLPPLPQSGAQPNGTGRPNPLLGGMPNPPEASNVPPVLRGGIGAPTPAQAPAPQRQTVTSLAPGEEPYDKAVADRAAEASGRTTHFAQDMTPLLGLHDALKDASTGPGKAQLNDLRSRLQGFTPSALSFFRPLGGDAKSIAAFDEASKYAAQIQRGQPGSQGSDAQLATAGKASPGPEISPQAAQYLTRALIAQRRMEQAGAVAFRDSGLAPARYDDFMSRWNGRQDPRAYAADLMPYTEREQMLKDMTGDERGHFLKSYADAKPLLDMSRKDAH